MRLITLAHTLETTAAKWDAAGHDALGSKLLRAVADEIKLRIVTGKNPRA